MEDIFGTINSITGITKYSSSEVITPKRIVADMVDLLPAGIYTPEAKFLDPAVKSGRFLAEIYRRLMDSELMKQAFPNTDERKLHIRRNQLYGFATSSLAAAVTRKQLYDDPQETGNIMYTADKVTKEMIQGAFGIMKFDVVIGNPPYNNDIYLDFVTLGHNLASKYTCMITPAKWQAKGGEKNEQFRKDIVPYMSKIVFYPCVTDIFDITSVGGITYYLISKEKADKVKLDIISVNPKSFHGNSSIEIDRSINRNTYYNTMLEQIVSKCISGKRLGNIIFKTIHEGTHMVKVSHLVDDKHYKNNMYALLGKPGYEGLRAQLEAKL
ncbi:Eco57I restriction-modification methylase domain-containing protein [Pseudoflavonifractor phocaeensis]|nr:Eco57I restriction-modification methylase domain-containing protein [Pseudoflavonifractor phocaeensis]